MCNSHPNEGMTHQNEIGSGSTLNVAMTTCSYWEWQGDWVSSCVALSWINLY